MSCPRCGAEVVPGDRFCADCGGRITAPEPPAAGGRAEAPGLRLAGRTDTGRAHPTNQDAFALSGTGGPGTLVVVCDGVSNSQMPEFASITAAHVAHDALVAAQDAGDEPDAAMADAIHRAHAAVCALPFDRQADLDPPATTIVAAWVHGAEAAPVVTLGWLGDSRAYALDPPGRLLTRDHSWMVHVLERGDMTEQQARRDPRAHALISCLGTTDFTAASPCPEPGILTIPAPPGWLVLCSDGLWNYAESPTAILQAAGAGVGGDAADLCARLVDFALDAGGRDNITVVAIRL